MDLSKIYFCLSSPTEPLYVGMFSRFSFTTLKNVDASTRPLLFMLPNRPMSVEEVSMDPEVMVIVDRLAFQYLSGTLRGFAIAVSER